MASITNRTKRTSRNSIVGEAARIVSEGHLHQSLWLPETNSHGQLRVTFATTSNFVDANLPTLLFCGPMFSSRWMVLDMDCLAVKNGVRIICVDRPGMGGSTRVPLKLRMQVWLETVPVLLGKLRVEHVGLFCHSTGTMYAINTLYHLRDILDPQMPYVAFMAPWVNKESPYTALMKAVSKIPNSLLDHWHDTIRFLQQRVSPITSWSGGIISSMKESTSSDSFTFAEKYGTTEEIGKEVERLKMYYLFQEDTMGVNEEARLCLRKEGHGCWGVCEDYFEFVRNLIELEKERGKSQPGQARLKVYAYFASSDVMIGKQGQDYFEQCWRQPGVEESITFESTVLDGTSHDSVIVDPKKGAIETIFKCIGSRVVE